MPGRVRFAWPPAPFVEEEPASLAKELNGLSKYNGKTGPGGAAIKGTVDQYPVILDVATPPASTIPPSDSSPPGLGNISSDDNSSGPLTPLLHGSDPKIQALSSPKSGNSKPVPSTTKESSSSASTFSSNCRGRSAPVYEQPSESESQSSRQPRPRSRSRARDSVRFEEPPVSRARSPTRGSNSGDSQYPSWSEAVPIARSRSTTRGPEPVESHTTRRPQSMYAAPSGPRDSAPLYSRATSRPETVYNTSGSNSGPIYSQPDYKDRAQTVYAGPRNSFGCLPVQNQNTRTEPAYNTSNVYRGSASARPQNTSRTDTIYTPPSDYFDPSQQPKSTKRPENSHNSLSTRAEPPYNTPSAVLGSTSTKSQYPEKPESTYTSGYTRGAGSSSRTENNSRPETVYAAPTDYFGSASTKPRNIGGSETYSSPSTIRGPIPVQARPARTEPSYSTSDTTRGPISTKSQYSEKSETANSLGSTRGVKSLKPESLDRPQVRIAPSISRSSDLVLPQSTARPEPPHTTSASARGPASVQSQTTSRPETVQITPNSRGSGPQPRGTNNRPDTVEIVPNSSRGSGSDQQSQMGPRREKTYSQGPTAPQPSLRRSNSTKTAPPATHPAPSGPRPEPKSTPSDPIVTRTQPSSYYGSPNKSIALPNSSTSGKSRATPSLAERIEEKLRLRHSRRNSGTVSDTEAPPQAPQPPLMNTKIAAPVSVSEPHSPVREFERAPSHRSQETKRPSRTRASSMGLTAPPPLRSALKNPNTSSEPVLSPDTSSTSSRRRRSNSVKFNEPVKIQVKREPSRKPSPSRSAPPPAPAPPVAPQQALIVTKPQDTTGLCTIPCPRSIPVGGLQDWYTMKGLEHLDICPSCMGQIAHSRFREYFVPSLNKPADQKVRCAFSNAWTRLAWTQMIKKHHPSLEMLYQMTRPPPGSSPCPGRTVSDQAWHRIVDPETGSYLPRFHVCNSCARNVRILMPSHRDTLEASPDVQERVCDFVTTSPRFVQYIDLLDSAATRTGDSARRPDLRDFLSYTRRKVVLRDCRRDRASLGNWHYIPSLPELSVCEDCYDEVVWPLSKAQQPIARMFSPTMRLLPSDGPNRCREASCQLYSPRMRARFREMVAKDDFAGLKTFAVRRFEAECRFRDRREELMIAEDKGYDVDAEMRKAVEEWRKWE